MSCACTAQNRLSALFAMASNGQKPHCHTPPSNTHVNAQTKLYQTHENTQHEKNRTLIRDGFIYCGNEENRVVENGWLLVKGKHIQAIGKMTDEVPAHDSVINAQGQMVMPGFINPHWHESFVAPNHERPDDSNIQPSPYANGGNIEALGEMFGFIATVGKKLSLEEGLAIARWSMWTQLRSGTTTLGDVGSANRSDALALAALDLGMRLRVSRWGSDIMIPNKGSAVQKIADTQEQTDDWLELLERWHTHPSGLIGAMPSVMGAFGSSDAQLMALSELVQKFNAPYAAHLAALKNEYDAVKRAFSCSSVQRFAKHNLLNDKLLSVHTAFASKEENAQLINAGVNICHSPAHYGMLGERTNSETRHFSKLLKQGVWLSSSTDGDITYTGGMCEAMRGAHLHHNEAGNCNTVCPPTLALKTGTLFGAKALHWLDRIGSLEQGKEADIVLVNINDFRYRQSLHPLRTFLVSGSSADIDTVVVQGRVLIQAGKSTQFNEDSLYQDYLNAAASARARIGQP